ncbi:SDR family oxidoreductase [Paludibacterium sp.]|uniref:SDR family oxidoreductase n=1 Tax=Paludibacterium sp. TaxID=1917523 RepID=UPI0025CEFC42|nr:SDR family oxidoreductase [Paludibacterium sp.]MBV8649423.1 SDR family oxidoreductase [Paludibacterium sp.]
MNDKLNRFNGAILMTGVTGGLGSALLPRLLRRYPHCEVVALIRGADASEVNARLAEALDFGGLAPAERARVSACRADIGQPRFGLDASVWHALAERTVRVFHLAASVDFGLPLAASRAANVDSTRQVLDFADACLRQGGSDFRLNYVSTAYVAGTRRGRLGENELGCGQGFCNAYEQSKLEAETLVTQAREQLPVTIYRPSQIIGETGSGRIRKFFGYYEFVRLAARDKIPLLVVNTAVRPDFVPTDYVCEAMLHLGELPHALGRTYHLTAGLARSPNFGLVFGSMYQELAAWLPPGRVLETPRMLSARELSQRATAQELQRFRRSPVKFLQRTYHSYLEEERDFDCDATQATLAAAGIVLPDIETVLRQSTRYALDARYGRAHAARNVDEVEEPSDAPQIA